MNRNRYVIQVVGTEKIARYLSKLKSVGTKISEVQMEEQEAFFKTDREGLKKVRKYRRRYGLKVKVHTAVTDAGLALLFKSYRFLVVLTIPFVCSFFLWSVTVESESPEVAERIEKKLEKDSIQPFRLLRSVPDEGEIRRELMQADPDLSWVRFKRTGTTLTVIPMLSPTLNEEVDSDGSPGNLVASTSGVVTRYALTKGERVARVYTTVKKGDILASGILEQGEEEVIVGAAGAVYADYWVEYTFNIPKVIDYKVQGEEKVEFVFLPPWQEKKQFGKAILNMFQTERIVNEENAQIEIEEGMEEEFIIPLLKMKLLAQLGPEAMIKENKILHVTFDDDKVKGTILFLINDNIAIKRPIPKETEAIE